MLLIQKYWHPISLDPSVYFVTSAPIYIDFGYIISLNLMILICFLVLIIILFGLQNQSSTVINLTVQLH